MFDLLFLVIVGLSTAFAALRGGLRELSTLLALAVAGGLTWITAPVILGGLGMTNKFIPTVVIAVVLIGAFFLVAHVGFHLGLKRVPLEGRAALGDRIGGGVFGFVRGLVLIGLGYLGYSYYLDVDQQPESVQNALTQPIANGMANWFESFAPPETQLENTQPDLGDGSDGYRRIERDGMEELVTTATTDDEPVDETASEDDDIAEILATEDQ